MKRRIHDKNSGLDSGIELVDCGSGSFSLSGSTSIENVGRMLTYGEEQFGDHKSISIDIAGADCANSPGLALLIEWTAGCRANGVTLVLERPQNGLLETVSVNDVGQLLSFVR